MLWTDGSRDENGAVGYAVVWKNRRSWAGRKVHMEFFQEAYDAECAEPGLGQTYALQARMAIAALRVREPSVEIETRWCPAHKGIPGNEVADG